MHQPDKERTPGQHHEGHWTMPADLSYPTCNHLSSLFRLLWTFLQSSVKNSICLVLFGVLEKKSVGHRVKIGPKELENGGLPVCLALVCVVPGLCVQMDVSNVRLHFSLMSLCPHNRIHPVQHQGFPIVGTIFAFVCSHPLFWRDGKGSNQDAKCERNHSTLCAPNPPPAWRFPQQGDEDLRQAPWPREILAYLLDEWGDFFSISYAASVKSIKAFQTSVLMMYSCCL